MRQTKAGSGKVAQLEQIALGHRGHLVRRRLRQSCKRGEVLNGFRVF